MATVNVLSTNAIAQAFPNSPSTRLRNVRLLVAVVAGQAGYFDPATGKAGLCNTATAGKQQFRGIFMRSGGATDVVTFLSRGELYGFDLSGSNFDDIIYAQDTDGAIGTAPGTKAVPIGRVVGLTDGIGYGASPTKVLLVAESTLANF